MAVEIGEEWDPGAHDYGQHTTDDGRLLGQIMGLTALSAFALVGVGAFFTYAAVEVGTALDISYTVGGTTIVAGGTAINPTLAEAIVYLDATYLNAAATEMLEAMVDTWALDSFSVDSLIALAAYQPTPLDAPNYGYFGGYLGNFLFQNGLPGGGISDPPGFPGFPGHGYPVWDPNATPAGFFCVKVNDEYMCHWEY